jgi:20S proteasome subunit beta 2
MSGFDFSNHLRNAHLEASAAMRGFQAPKATSTGTTLCALVFKDGVVIGADTRA